MHFREKGRVQSLLDPFHLPYGASALALVTSKAEGVSSWTDSVFGKSNPHCRLNTHVSSKEYTLPSGQDTMHSYSCCLHSSPLFDVSIQHPNKCVKQENTTAGAKV